MTEEKLLEIIKKSKDRFELCSGIIADLEAATMAELGVYRGDFVQKILKICPNIQQYYMIDPWRNLDDWNKPANKTNDIFEDYYQETMSKVEFAKEKCTVLRGTTLEMVDKIPDESLDCVYIDGDHTLRGITLDLMAIWPKLKEGGYILGDDFTPTIWQHNVNYEPSFVFPFSVYFAEAKGAKIYGLSNNQFLLQKKTDGYNFVDLSGGKYPSLQLLGQLKKTMTVRSALSRKFPKLFKVYKSIFRRGK